MLPGSPVSPAEVLGVSRVEAHSREGRSALPHPVLGVGSVEAGSTQRTHTRSSSEYPCGFYRLTK